jgi:crossover junction endodeoxyribonuclease RuvC
MRVVSLDPSLTAFGLADSDRPAEPWVLVPRPGLHGWARIHWLYVKVMEACERADLVVREGYAYASATNAISAGELGGVIGYGLWRRQTQLVTIAPNALKKIATGVGKGGKGGVLVEAVKRLGYRGSDHNAADAMWLLQAALQHYELPGRADLPKSHIEKLGNIKWPTLEELAAA